MMRLAVFLIGCVALSVAQFQILPQTLPAGWPYFLPPVTPAPVTAAPVTAAPVSVPTTTPPHFRNLAAEQQLAHTIVAHEQSNLLHQQNELQQLLQQQAQLAGIGRPVAAVAPTAPTGSTAQTAQAAPAQQQQYVLSYPFPGFPAILG